MSRNVQFQVLRGTQSQFLTLQTGLDPDSGSAVNALQEGEMYFATDTGNLFFGTPGFGSGYITIGDTTNVNETLIRLLKEVKAMRLAIVQMATEDHHAEPGDFEPDAADDTSDNGQ